MSETVAVITRTRDRLPLLKRAVASVLDQKHTDWVHVIVNDGGDAPALDAFLEPYQERYGERLKVVHFKRNTGMQNAANRGIRESESTYVAIHDDDDAWHPSFLKTTVAYLQKAGTCSPYQGVITHSLKITEKAGEDGTCTELDRKPYIPLDEISFFRAGYENPFPPIAFLYRRSVHDVIGMFDQRWEEAGDLDFNIRFLQQFEIGVVPKPYAYYHFRTDASGSLTNSQVARSRESHRRVTELKNHYLRGEQPSIPPTTALALQIAYFLVENQWKTNSNYEAINRLDERVFLLIEELCGDSWRDRFTTLREGVAQALDNLKSLNHGSRTHSAALNDTHSDLAKKLNDLLSAQSTLSQSVQERSGSTEQSIAYLRELLEEHLLPNINLLRKEAGDSTSNLHTDVANKLNGLLGAQSTLSTSLQEGIGNSERSMAYLNDLIEQHLLPNINQLRTELLPNINPLRTELLLNINQLRTETGENVSSLHTDVANKLNGLLDERAGEAAFRAEVTAQLAALREERTLLRLGPVRLSFRRKTARRDRDPS